MERWDSYYFNYGYPRGTYTGASHVRYPRPDNHAGGSSTATDNGATCWSATQTSAMDSGPDSSPPASPISPDSQVHIMLDHR